MFEKLIAETASRLNLSSTSVSALVRGLLGLMSNERTGGIEGFIAMFRRVGLGDAITSSFGGREGMTLMPAQVESALGQNALNGLAASTGLTPNVVSAATAFVLPKLIGLITPNGVLPSTASLRAQVSNDIDRTVAAPGPRVDRGGTSRWVPWATAALLALGAWMLLRGPAERTDPQLTASNRDMTAQAVRAANERARSALEAVGTTGVSPSATAVVRAMNLGVINFAEGSARIPAENATIIRQSADALKRAPGGSRIEIGGHTDNTGDPARNLALSQRRADAVKEALITAGVPAAMLTAKGYGDTKPRAGNDTEPGRFQNRRIEYSVVQ